MPEMFIKDFPLSEYNRLKEIEKKAKDKAFIPFKLNDCCDVYYIARTESDKQFNAFAKEAKIISDDNLELRREIEKRKEQFANLAWEYAEKKVKIDKLEKEIESLNSCFIASQKVQQEWYEAFFLLTKKYTNFWIFGTKKRHEECLKLAELKNDEAYQNEQVHI
ncbi:MAG: hypothetical protein IPO16_14975 [Saprospiraceae bacterium]|nr:hypothetical protein [Saprospiraceae bacterium]